MVPSELGNCSQLQVIQLRSNRLIGNVTADFSRLSRLKELDLGSNKLNGEIPDSLSNMSNLKYLNLSRNNLEGEIPSGLGSLFNDSSISDFVDCYGRWWYWAICRVLLRLHLQSSTVVEEVDDRREEAEYG
ncbi:hypothetical protein Gotur_017660 [Gossypium turneri]